MNLITRSDFDGLVCAAILKDCGIIDAWTFVHPKDLQDKVIKVTENDVLANVPYVPGCGMWFDHHSSETERVKDIEYKGESRMAKSAARIVYEYYGGKEKMPQFVEILDAVDKVDSGDLDIDEVINPTGGVLLGFVMDPRTGLGRFRDYRISNYALMGKLIDTFRLSSISEIIEDSDIKERIDRYKEQTELFKEMIREHSKIKGNAIVTDLRGVSAVYTGNRFLIYGMYPESNISLWIVGGKGGQNASIAVGHSIINRTSKTDVGSLLLSYGGGGHKRVGTCQMTYNECDRILEELISKINADG